MHSRRLVSGVISATTLAVAISSGAVFAQDTGQVRVHGMPDQQEQLSENISYADLNLATSSGARALKSRARDAASSICQKLGDDQSNRGPGALEHQIQCVNGALGAAMPQINRAIASAEQTQQRGMDGPK